MKSNHVLAACCLVAALLLASGCDAWKSGPDPLATDIKEIRVEPNPVPMGEEVTITVVTPDSARSDLTYEWVGFGAIPPTTVPRLVWTASLEPGEYGLSVVVLREGNYEAVGQAFSITVTEPD